MLFSEQTFQQSPKEIVWWCTQQSRCFNTSNNSQPLMNLAMLYLNLQFKEKMQTLANFLICCHLKENNLHFPLAVTFCTNFRTQNFVVLKQIPFVGKNYSAILWWCSVFENSRNSQLHHRWDILAWNKDRLTKNVMSSRCGSSCSHQRATDTHF